MDTFAEFLAFTVALALLGTLVCTMLWDVVVRLISKKLNK